jgi:glucosamine--fructose-6-phosphate aminotransferase (isomerizing)
VADEHSPGARMAAEMAEQPARLAALVDRWDGTVAQVRALAWPRLTGSVIAARGSSDHAGAYGRYLLELVSGRPVAMAAPSIQTLYGAHVDHSGFLAIAVSQSGRTPEILRTLERMQDSGAAGLAITNDGSSPLARAAQATLSLEAGAERAVPATKTVTATMTAFAIVAAALGAAPYTREQAAALPGLVADVLADPEPAEALACRLAGADRLAVVGRGLMYGAALETALKVKETTRIPAEAFSAADLRHGPIAVIEPGFSVLALWAEGPARADVADLADDLRRRGADVAVAADEDGAALPLPRGVPEALAPVLAVVRAQQLALAIARRRGLDPDAPEGLTKVTVT